ncbi:TPA: permease [Candidatus Saccharibacteria bacterium]|nr:permease [Candidatus Saccharibacteria bacterium]HIO87331.1 permease [Candidatus Saccharibacteria bacterium]
MSVKLKQTHIKNYAPPLLIVVATYTLLTIIDAVQSSSYLPNTLQDFVTLSLSIFVEAFPFLVLGSILAAVVNTYVPAHAFEKILPKQGVLRRGIISLLGFLFPVCECGNVPLSRALMQQGLKPSESITFLLAAPVINPVTIWSTVVAFGFDQTIIAARIIATLLIANIIGYILSTKKNENDFLTDDFAATCTTITAADTKKSSRKEQFTQFGSNFTHEAFSMARMLAFGALIAGTVQTFVPRDLLVGIGSNVVLSIVAMLILAFVISICANVDAFFALSFANTFTAGSIVSFLVFGPMIDIKMLALLKTTFKTNLLIVISVLSLLLSFIAGLVVAYGF